MFKLRKQYRLYGYDYSQNGYYFITVVTKNREQQFGEIMDSKMHLSSIGDFAREKFLYNEVLENPLENNPYFINKASYIITINEFEIMPDHIHLIVEIINKQLKEPCVLSGLHPLVEGSVSSFINHFKGKIKRWCTENSIAGFEWQRRFHDRIIRDSDEYSRISVYIKNNIANWDNDKIFLP